MKSRVHCRQLMMMTVAAVLLSLTAEVVQAANVATNWTVGEERTYRFKIGSAPIGTHTAKLVSYESVPGAGPVYLFDMHVLLDMNAIGQDFRADLACSLYCSASGLPLRYVADYNVRGQLATVEGNVAKDVFSGTANLSGYDTTFTLNIPPGTFIADNNFTSQWELGFYNQPLAPGETPRLDVLVPQILRRVPMDVTTIDSESIQFGGTTVECSVVRIDLINNTLYFDKSGKLLRVIDSRQNLTIELLTPEEAAQVGKPGPEHKASIGRRVLIWAIYSAFAAVMIIFLSRVSLGDPLSWIVLGLSGISFSLVIYVQAPVQQRLAATVFSSIGKSGSGVYVAAFLIAAVSGLFQEGLKALLVWLKWNFSQIRPNLKIMTAVGAMVGAGFGIIEAGWTTGGLYAAGALDLISLAVWERIVTILFHIGVGTIVGYGVGRKKWIQYGLFAAILHSVGNFSIVFLREGYVDAIIFEMLLTVYDAAVFFVALWLWRRVSRR